MEIRVTLIVAVVVLTMGVAYANERAALEAFYEALDGDQWTQSGGWLTDAPLDAWYGVEVVGGHIVGLELPDNGLRGELPDALATLDRLNSLDLRWNRITGLIPASLGGLASLETLLLSGNQLTGSIPPSLGLLSGLKRMDLSYNALTGEIPEVFGELSSLQSIGLQHNRLSGSIPQEMGSVSTLQRVIVNNNDLYGLIPFGFREIDGLHLNVASNLIDRLDTDSMHGEVVAIVRKSAETPSGVDMLNETTHVFDDDNAIEFVTDVMRAIEVRDGLLHLHDKILPSSVDVGLVRDLIDGMNDRLVEEGETIQSVNDLERVFELYSPGTIEVPTPFGTEYLYSEGKGSEATFRFKSSSASSSSSRNVVVLSNSQGSHSSGNVTWNIVTCAPLIANHVHVSHTEPDYLHGKIHGSCHVLQGVHDIHYDLYSTIARKTAWWIFTRWVIEAMAGGFYEYGSRGSWSQSETLVRLYCHKDDDYRTQALVYIRSGTAGLYFPYPALVAGTSQRIDC